MSRRVTALIPDDPGHFTGVEYRDGYFKGCFDAQETDAPARSPGGACEGPGLR